MLHTQQKESEWVQYSIIFECIVEKSKGARGFHRSGTEVDPTTKIADSAHVRIIWHKIDNNGRFYFFTRWNEETQRYNGDSMKKDLLVAGQV